MSIPDLSKQRHDDFQKEFDDDVPRTNLLRAIGDRIWIVDSKGNRGGASGAAPGSATTVVCSLGNGAWIWNPDREPCTAELSKEIYARCGAIRHVTMPSSSSSSSKQQRPQNSKGGSHLYDWCTAHASGKYTKFHAPPDWNYYDNDNEEGQNEDHDDKVVNVDFVLTDQAHPELHHDIVQIMFRPSSDVVFFHRPSRTLLFGNALLATTATAAEGGWGNTLSSFFKSDDGGTRNSTDDLYIPYTTRLQYWWKGEEAILLARKSLHTILHQLPTPPLQLVLEQGGLINLGSHNPRTSSPSNVGGTNSSPEVLSKILMRAFRPWLLSDEINSQEENDIERHDKNDDVASDR